MTSMEELLPDDRLDELFRKSAEEFEPTYEPKAWEAMRKKLEKPERDPAGWLIRGGIALGLLLLLLGGGYWWLGKENQDKKSTNNTSSNTTQNQPIQSTNPIATIPTVTDKAQSNSNTKVSDNEKIIKKETNENNAIITPKNASKIEATKAHQPTNKIAIASKNSAIITEATTTEDLATRGSKITRKQSIQTQLPTTTHRKVAKRQKQYLTKGVLNEKVESNTTSSESFIDKAETKTTLPTPNTVVAEPTPHTPQIALNSLSIKQIRFENLQLIIPTIDFVPPTLSTLPPEEPTPAIYKKGLSIRIATLPDWSYITQAQMPKDPQWGWNGMLEYRFAKRWSVQAGVVKSKKIYNATGDQYQWPSTWAPQKAYPTTVSADCDVLDFPVNIRYDLTLRPYRRWFVATGISSYKMVNEKYTYTYPPHTYGVKKTWEGSSGNYWGGILNMSVGVEQRIFNRLSIQIEPSFKMPLGQIGMGKVKLRSTGVFISAKYMLWNTK